jgi:predicted HTH transcriptional regulator
MYLLRFFGNLLFEENNPLKNREMHIRFKFLEDLDENVPINVPINDENVPINVPIIDIEQSVLELIMQDPMITYEEIAAIIQKDRKTVQRAIKILKEKGMISRLGSNKTGSWEVLKK